MKSTRYNSTLWTIVLHCTSILRAYWSCFDRDRVRRKLPPTRYKPQQMQTTKICACHEQPTPYRNFPTKTSNINRKKEKKKNKRKKHRFNACQHVNTKPSCILLVLTRYVVFSPITRITGVWFWKERKTRHSSVKYSNMSRSWTEIGTDTAATQPIATGVCSCIWHSSPSTQGNAMVCLDWWCRCLYWRRGLGAALLSCVGAVLAHHCSKQMRRNRVLRNY